MKKRRTSMLRKERRWRKLFLVECSLVESKTLQKMALSSNFSTKKKKKRIMFSSQINVKNVKRLVFCSFLFWQFLNFSFLVSLFALISMAIASCKRNGKWTLDLSSQFLEEYMRLVRTKKKSPEFLELILFLVIFYGVHAVPVRIHEAPKAQEKIMPL